MFGSQRTDDRATIKGDSNMSKTDDNLRAAFEGESLARNKYTYYAQMARREGYLADIQNGEDLKRKVDWLREESRLVPGTKIS